MVKGVNEVVHGNGGMSLDEKYTLTVTINLHTVVFTVTETGGHWVKKDEGLTQSLFQNVGVEEIGSPVWFVEIDGGKVVIPHQQI